MVGKELPPLDYFLSATVVRDGKLSEGKTVQYNGEEVSVKL